MRLQLLGICFAIACTSAFAENEQLLNYARTNVGKFLSEEVPVGALRIGNTVTVRMRTPFDEAVTNYNGLDEVLPGSAAPFPISVSEACRNVGTYTAQNAFGVRARVTRQSCTEFVVDDGGYQTREIALRISPAQYRALKRDGIRAELDVLLKTDGDGRIAYSELTFNRPTITSPFDVETRRLAIFGSVLAVRWVLPGEGLREVWKLAPPIAAVAAPHRVDEPSNSYIGRLLARIRPNFVASNPDANLVAEIEIALTGDGTVTETKLVQSSGDPIWDQQVIRAVKSTEVLPRDIDGRVPPTVRLKFSARN